MGIYRSPDLALQIEQIQRLRGRLIATLESAVLTAKSANDGGLANALQEKMDAIDLAARSFLALLKEEKQEEGQEGQGKPRDSSSTDPRLAAFFTQVNKLVKVAPDAARGAVDTVKAAFRSRQ